MLVILEEIRVTVLGCLSKWADIGVLSVSDVDLLLEYIVISLSRVHMLYCVEFFISKAQRST